MSKVVEILKTAIALSMQGADVDNIYKILDELDECKVKVWREDDTVKLPTYGKDGDACMDVYVHSIEYKDDGRVVYHTGLHFALPEDYEMKIRPRSSMTKTLALMQNAPGTLDQGYRGELMIVHRQIDDPTNSCAEYKVGDRVAQILVSRRERIVWEEVKTQEELGDTERGAGGFGSTGK